MSSITQILFDKWANEKDSTSLKEDFKSRLSVGTWIVEFMKVDGTPAVMECTLDPKFLPSLKEGVEPRPEGADLIHAYSIDRRGWRSFRVANVKAFYQKPESL